MSESKGHLIAQFRPVWVLFIALLFASSPALFVSQTDINVPDLTHVRFGGFGGMSGAMLMNIGLVICAIGVAFGLVQYVQIRSLPVHGSMAAVSDTIWETCKTCLFTRGKLLAILWVLIAACMMYYFGVLQHNAVGRGVVILLASILGILGSYGVAWFGIRINTVSNSRTAFSALKGDPLATFGIPLRSGMSVGLLLVAVELFFMICILMFLPRDLVGPCFIGFAIGESLGASVLRICGGIFTKVANIGSDLMKIVFKLPEDDPKNPGIIADCTDDNASDSVRPTADGFETYGVTGVALIAFLALALAATPTIVATLIIWLFVMRALMIVTSLLSYFVNEGISKVKFGGQKDFDFEAPLSQLVWITSAVSIALTFLASKLLLGDFKDGAGNVQPDLWWVLSVIVSCGIVAGALIPKFTKAFVKMTSCHLSEVTNSSKHGGDALNILPGFVAGNLSAFWMGLVLIVLMFTCYHFSSNPALIALMPSKFLFAAPIFAFGLVAFGFLGMGPVTIAVDNYGPVTDNAQSVYELSQIEARPGIKDEIKRDFSFQPDFQNAKHQLEKGGGAGNIFKATKPVLVGTAVVGATRMVFGIIILLENLFSNIIPRLSIVQPEIIMGFIMGGAVIYWFTSSFCHSNEKLFIACSGTNLSARGIDISGNHVSMPSLGLTFRHEMRDAIDQCYLDGVDDKRRAQIPAPTVAIAETNRQLLREVAEKLHVLRGHGESKPLARHIEYLAQFSESVAPIGKLTGVPSLPTHFLSRSDHLQSLKDALLADHRQPIVVHGVGGIGKTVLTNLLVRDTEVRRAFPDGIVWVPIGPEPNIAELQRSVAKVFTDPDHLEDVQSHAKLREILASKAVLLVLDDLSERADFEAFNFLGPRCRVVVTTRHTDILGSLEGIRREVQLLTENESLLLFARVAGMGPKGLSREVRAILSEGGYLPLTVALFGGMVERGVFQCCQRKPSAKLRDQLVATPNLGNRFLLRTLLEGLRQFDGSDQPTGIDKHLNEERKISLRHASEKECQFLADRIASYCYTNTWRVNGSEKSGSLTDCDLFVLAWTLISDVKVALRLLQQRPLRSRALADQALHGFARDFALRLNFDVVLEDSPETPASCIQINGHRKIYLHKKLSLRKQAWGICHEIAHIVLNHTPVSEYGLDSSALSADRRQHFALQEREADSIAAIWCHFFDFSSEPQFDHSPFGKSRTRRGGTDSLTTLSRRSSSPVLNGTIRQDLQSCKTTN